MVRRGACEARLGLRGIAHQTIKSRRVQKRVPVAADGTLADYVPFYFTSRSPMLYSIHTGFVEGYSGGQREILHLVSSAEQVAQTDRAWCFTDGHALEWISEFFDDLTDLDKVDWDVIRSWSWRNRPSDFDRKRRKQAELLVHESFCWEWLEGIGVLDNEIAQRVERMLNTAPHRPTVRVHNDWYY